MINKLISLHFITFNLNLFIISQHSKLYQEAYLKKTRFIYKQRVTFVQNELAEILNFHQQLTNKENLRFLINKWNIKLSQEAEKLTVLKEKLEEYIRRL